MMKFTLLIAQFTDLSAAELANWIDAAWVQPEPAGASMQEWIFHDIDIARVRLIYDLRRHLATPEDLIPMVLALLDQVYELRCSLHDVQSAIQAQPSSVQAAILAALRRN